jgi:glycosyltransferase involved in cell wall biosynthesis
MPLREPAGPPQDAPHSSETHLVSIVLPTFNGARYLRQSIESCLNQTYRPIELIVVDGGSTDGTAEILSSYPNTVLTVLHQPANAGRLPGALNIGFAHSKGEYLTWMQDDDLYEPEAIERMVHFLEEHSDVDFVYADYWWIDDAGRKLRTSEVAPIENLRTKDCIGQCFLYRREVYRRVGNYDPTYIMAEDMEYWFRISLKHKMQLYPQPLYAHRWHAGSLTVREYGRYEAIRVAAKARRRWLRTGWNLYRQAVARAYIEEMFASHAAGDLDRRRRALIRGLLYDPSWLENRGVASVLLETVLGHGASQRARRFASALAGLPGSKP